MKLTKYHYQVLMIKSTYYMMDVIRSIIFIKIVIIKKDCDDEKML